MIEDLCLDVWLDLFSYFDGSSLATSFAALNSQIEDVLSTRHLRVHWNLFSSVSLLPAPFRFDQIRSLTLDYSRIGNDERIDLSPFIGVRSLHLISIDENRLLNLRELPWTHLVQLKIRSRCARSVSELISISFAGVRRMSLDSMGKPFIVKSRSRPTKPSQLRELELNGRMKLAHLSRLWSLVRMVSFVGVRIEGISSRFLVFVVCRY